MIFLLTFAEYSVVNAIKGLEPQAVAMLMGAKIGGHRTWVIEAKAEALASLRTTLQREIAISSSTAGSTMAGSGILSRVAAKIDDLLAHETLPPAPAAEKHAS